MKNRKLRQPVLVLLLLFCTSASAQELPCDTRRALAEAQAGAASVRAETSDARRALVEEKLEDVIRKLSTTESILMREQENTTNLTILNERIRLRLAELESQLTMAHTREVTLTNERNMARLKKRRADKRTWAAVVGAALLGIIAGVK